METENTFCLALVLNIVWWTGNKEKIPFNISPQNLDPLKSQKCLQSLQDTMSPKTLDPPSFH